MSSSVLLLLAACTSMSLALLPRCFCPIEFNPVCGTNGRGYLSHCILKCAIKRGENVELERKGPCSQPPCTCSDNYKPVCGSDGVTYGNDCLLNCATADDSTLSIAHAGTCAHTVIVVDQPDCNCPENFKPVCGTDGVTYNNECLMQCAGQSLARRGPCEPPCTCPRQEKPVCGSDGTTYSNPCLLNCATKENSRLKIANVGPCEETGGILVVGQPGCTPCDSELKPVCGSDLITYDNECLLQCSGADFLKEGPCEPPCTCSDEEDLVCGSDDVTYNNACWLNCATKDDSSLRISHAGPCGGSVNVVDNPDCSCTRELHPVCGMDSVTYNNECLLKCAGQELAKDGQCEPACTCPRQGKAVCGSDGRTYSNVCLLNCATKDDHTLRVSRPGPCKQISPR